MSDGVMLRREFLLEPGEAFILTDDLFELADRFTASMEAFGLPDHRFVASPVVALPLPQPDDGDVLQRRPWSDVNAEMMWHPFFWLPEFISARMLIQRPDGGEYLESDEEYLLRVIGQCTVAGLFDIEMGTWLDVLAYAGLDSESQDTLDRVRQWQEGASDPVLDAIDLSSLFTESDPEGAIVQQVYSDAPDQVSSQWALTADYVGRALRDMRAANPDDDDEREYVVGTMLVLAYAGFAGGELIGDAVTRPAVMSLIMETQQEGADFDGITQRALELCAEQYMKHQTTLQRILDEADELERLHREGESPGPAFAPSAE